MRVVGLISGACLLLGCATEILPVANDTQCSVVRAAMREDVEHTFGYALDPNRFELSDRPLLVVGEDQAFAKFREFGLSEPIASSLAEEIDARHLVPLRVRCEGVRWTRRNEFGTTIWDTPIFL